MSGVIGQPVSRVDGRAKVTGSATYAGEFHLSNFAYAALVLSTVPRGTIAKIETAEAEHAPGVRAVITHLNAPRLAYLPLAERPAVDPKSGEQLRVFQSPEILFSGQPIGVVVADTLEEAQYAATRVRVRYETSDAKTQFDVGAVERRATQRRHRAGREKPAEAMPIAHSPRRRSRWKLFTVTRANITTPWKRMAPLPNGTAAT